MALCLSLDATTDFSATGENALNSRLSTEIPGRASSVTGSARESRVGAGRVGLAYTERSIHCRIAGILARVRARRLYELLVWFGTSGLGHNNYNPRTNGEERFVRKWLEARQNVPLVVFDLGANEGWFTDLAVRYHPTVTVHAFEPHPATSARLSARLSEIARVNVQSMGVSDQPGELDLHDSDDQGSHLASFQAEAVAGPMLSHKVPVTTIAKYCREAKIERIDYMKIDVEGHERHVLMGLGTIRPTTIHMEINTLNAHSGLTLFAIMKLLHGYDFYRIMPWGLLPLVTEKRQYRAVDDTFRYCNIVATVRG